MLSRVRRKTTRAKVLYFITLHHVEKKNMIIGEQDNKGRCTTSELSSALSSHVHT